MDKLKKSEIYCLAAISVCVALGDEVKLEKEIHSALGKGIAIEVIKEVILQCYLFAGFPRAINGFWVLDSILYEHRENKDSCFSEPPNDISKWLKRGEKLCKKIYGDTYYAMLTKMRRFHIDFAFWILIEGYGKVLSRKFLSPKVRELLIIPILVALGLWRQLPSHIKGAINVGASKSEIIEVLQEVRYLVGIANFRKAKANI